MRVSAWKNIDVEVEVDVTLDDCINELLDIANSDDGERRKLSAIEGATRVLEKLTPELLQFALNKHPGAIDLIHSRLAKWIDATRAEDRSKVG